MKFGPVAPADALGATAVHSIRQGDLVLKKGTLIGPAEVAALTAACVKEIVVARLEPGDVSEDQAAADIAAAVKGEGFRGRASTWFRQRRSRWKYGSMAQQSRVQPPRHSGIPARVSCSSSRAIPPAAPQSRDATVSSNPSCRCAARY